MKKYLLASLVLGALIAPYTSQAAITCPPYIFSRNLTLQTLGEDVRQLQKFFNHDPATQVAITGPGAPGNETTRFGFLTQAAVVKFQEKHKNDVLAPFGLAQGTGFFGPASRGKANSLWAAFCGNTQNLPPGCLVGDLFSRSTGKSCNTPARPCAPGHLFNTETGVRCPVGGGSSGGGSSGGGSSGGGSNSSDRNKITGVSISNSNPVKGTTLAISWSAGSAVEGYKIYLIKNGSVDSSLITISDKSTKFYNWPIPSSPTYNASDNYQIRVCPKDDASSSNQCDNSSNFIIRNSTVGATISNVTATSPMTQGNSATISWSKTGTINSYDILFAKSASQQVGIVYGYSTTSTSYIWSTVGVFATTIPSWFAADGVTNYFVRVCISGTATCGNSAVNIKVNPSLTVDSLPASIVRGASVNIHWQHGGAAASAYRIYLLKASDNSLIDTIIDGTSGFNFLWPAGQIGGDSWASVVSGQNSYKIKVCSIGSNPVCGTSNSFNLSPGTLTVQSMASPLSTNHTYPVVWTDTGFDVTYSIFVRNSIGNVLRLVPWGTPAGGELISVLPYGNARQMTFYWSVPNVLSGGLNTNGATPYWIKICRDYEATPLCRESEQSFVIDEKG